MRRPHHKAPPPDGTRAAVAARRRRRAGAWLVLCFPAIAAAHPPLAALIPALAQAPPSVRADFARAALDEMAAAYADEADRAWRAERVARSDRDVGRWAAGTEAYAEQIGELARSVTLDTPAELRLSAGRRVEILLPGRSVVVSGPRIAEPGRLEERVLDRFCSTYDCSALVPETGAEAEAGGTDPAPDAAPATASAHWSFSDGAGPTCSSDDGLRFLFDDRRDLARRRVACAEVVKELQALADHLAQARARGVAVDWSAFAVRPLSEGAGDGAPAAGAGAEDPSVDHVQLNREGEYLRLPLPALASAAHLLRLARPWLDATSRGVPYRQTFSRADALLAPVLSRGAADETGR